MTDYLNPHRIYPDCPSRRIDNPRGSEEKGGHMTDTGLVPCGCGGKAKIGQYCEVTCDKCGASVPANYTEADAKAAWNRAMGWRAEG